MSQVRRVVYLNSEREADVIEWLSKQPSASTAIRHALCAWVRGGQQEQATATIDLSAIRQVVEAALDARLSGLSVTSAAEEAGDEAQELLKDMVDELVM